jgi:hypothetical protein
MSSDGLPNLPSSQRSGLNSSASGPHTYCDRFTPSKDTNYIITQSPEVVHPRIADTYDVLSLLYCHRVGGLPRYSINGFREGNDIIFSSLENPMSDNSMQPQGFFDDCLKIRHVFMQVILHCVSVRELRKHFCDLRIKTPLNVSITSNFVQCKGQRVAGCIDCRWRMRMMDVVQMFQILTSGNEYCPFNEIVISN